MNKRNYKLGFTLVELLAVIVILAIILVIAVPQIMSVIKNAKEGSLLSSAKLIASEAERAYTEKLTLRESTDNITCSSVAKINDVDYDSCEIKFIDNIAHVKLIGSGKFDGMNVCDATKSTGEVTKNCAEIATTYITNLYNNETTRTSNGLEKDDTDDLNIRYSGPDSEVHLETDTTNYVKNYVYFNCNATDSSSRAYGSDNYDYEHSCEKWRIIGIFDVASTIGGITEKRLKIIRDDKIGGEKNYSWDTNSSLGYNIWETLDETSTIYKSDTDLTTKADVNRLLNEWYLGTNNSLTCYKGNSESTEDCPEERLSTGVGGQGLIDNAEWNLGGYGSPSISPKNAYIGERSGTPGNGFSTIAKTTWIGKVGLMYLSDYGYSSKDSGCRSSMQNSANSVYTCKLNNWLYKSDYGQWTLSPNSDSNLVFFVLSSGFVSNYATHKAWGIRPVVYLKSTVKIVNGEGSSSLPYILTV